jgi:hypothetical protein
MEAKHDVIFDEVVAACRAKHLRDVMSFQKNLNNEIIAQVYATLFVEEWGNTRKFHWITEGRQYEIIFSSLLGSLDLDSIMQTVSRFTLHPILMLAG